MPELPESRQNTVLALKIVGFSVLAGIFLYVILELKVLIICLIFALTIASAIAPVAEWAEQKRVPRLATVLVIYTITGLVYMFLAASLVPTIIEQGMKLYESLPAYVNKVIKWYHTALNLAGSNADAIAFHLEDMKGLAAKFVGKTMNMTAGIAGLLVNTVLTLFLSAYFVVEAKTIIPSLLEWLPDKVKDRIAPLITPLESRLGGYVRGQLLVAAAVAFILIAGFSLIGLKYALILGLVAGLLNLVPYVGSIIATAGAVVVAFNQDPILSLAALGVYAVEQWIESSFLVPHLLGKHVELHPLVVLLTILCGATLLGIAGALISVPLTSAALLLAEEFYLKPLKAKRQEAEKQKSTNSESDNAA